ncbi:MAG: hypothetical protein GXY83_07545 [Rhodopirellula sp.]|nr:hypothetical protein [Rhodopirellula sp.]
MGNAGNYPEQFPSTHWSMISQAREDDSMVKRAAIERLLERSLPALRAHLIYGKRLREDRADDLLQEFVAAKVLEKDLFGRADRHLGKFRTFLLTALERFVWNCLRNDRAKKRAAGEGALAGGEDWTVDVSGGDCPSAEFDKAWARQIIRDALNRMQEECERSQRAELWGLFDFRVVRPMLEGTPAPDYRELVARFGYPSPVHANNALVTAKRMYARILRAVIGEYTRDEGEIDSEIVELHRVLAAGGKRATPN